MKKTFVVEIEYKELQDNVEKNADVLYAESLEAHIANLMFEYEKHKSISSFHDVNVKERKCVARSDSFCLKKVKGLSVR